MTSGSSYNIWNIMKRRLWFSAICFLAFFFALPVNIALSLQNYTDWREMVEMGDAAAYSASYVQRLLENLFSYANWPVVMVMVLAAVLGGLSFFSYLMSRRKTDFYHSLPVTRGKMFITHWGAAVVSIAIPYLVNLLISFFVVIAYDMLDLFSFSSLGLGIVMHLLFAVAILTLTVLATVICGNIIIAGLLTGFLNGFIPLFSALLLSIVDIFYPTYYAAIHNWDGLITWGSPFTCYISTAESGSFTLVKAVILVAFIVVIFALGLFLYRARPSETSGRAIAFPKIKPVIKLLVVLFCTTGMGMFFHYMGDSGSTVSSFPWWFAFGSLCGAVISAQVIEIIYHMDFHAVRKHPKSLLAFMVVYLLCLVVAVMDLTGYNSYIPDRDEIQSAYVKFDGVNNYLYYNSYYNNSSAYSPYSFDGNVNEPLTTMDEWDYLSLSPVTDPAAIAALTSIAQKYVAYASTGEYQASAEYPVADSFTTGMDKIEAGYTLEDNYNYTSFSVVYTLKDGSVVSRSYEDMLPVDLIYSELCAIYNQPGFVLSQHQLFTYPQERIRINYVNSYEYVAADNKDSLNSLLGVRSEKLAALLNSYAEDIALLTPEYLRTHAPCGSISFCVFGEDPGDINYEDLTELSYLSYEYPIYPGFTATIAALEDLGIDDSYWKSDLDAISYIEITKAVELPQPENTPADGSLVEPDAPVSAMSSDLGIYSEYDESVEDYDVSYLYEYETRKITGRFAIEDVMAKTVSGDACYYNSFIHLDYLSTVWVYYQYDDAGIFEQLRYYVE